MSPGLPAPPTCPSHLELSLGEKRIREEANFPRSSPLQEWGGGVCLRAPSKVRPSWRELLGFHAHSWGERDYLSDGDPARQGPDPQSSLREGMGEGFPGGDRAGGMGKPFICLRPTGHGLGCKWWSVRDLTAPPPLQHSHCPRSQEQPVL